MTNYTILQQQAYDCYQLALQHKFARKLKREALGLSCRRVINFSRLSNDRAQRLIDVCNALLETKPQAPTKAPDPKDYVRIPNDVPVGCEIQYLYGVAMTKDWKREKGLYGSCGRSNCPGAPKRRKRMTSRVIKLSDIDSHPDYIRLAALKTKPKSLRPKKAPKPKRIAKKDAMGELYWPAISHHPEKWGLIYKAPVLQSAANSFSWPG